MGVRQADAYPGELQRMRFSTWNTPRYVCSAELSVDGARMILPRGLLSQCVEIGELAGAEVQMTDLHQSMAPIPVAFTGKLMPPQKAALSDLMSQDSGAPVAPPGAGKTVIAYAAIAQRKLPTLILVHRKQLADQWKNQLLGFTDLSKDQIGVFGPDERQRRGLVDIAMLRTLARDPESLLRGYGHIIAGQGLSPHEALNASVAFSWSCGHAGPGYGVRAHAQQQRRLDDSARLSRSLSLVIS